MKTLRHILLTASFILLPWFAQIIQACQCLEPPPPCADYWETDAVFVGLVTNISPDNEDYEASAQVGKRTVTFSLDRAFRGVEGKEAQLQSDITSCEYRFEKGKRYFVYAYRNTSTNTLGTNGCTRTTLLSNATEDLAFVRSLSGGATELLISGIILEKRYTPVKGVKVVAEGNGKQYKSLTDTEGRFRIVVPKTGKYTTRIVLPRNSDVVGYQHQLEKITRRLVNNDQVTLEYDVDVDAGRCAFIDVPLFIDREGP